MFSRDALLFSTNAIFYLPGSGRQQRIALILIVLNEENDQENEILFPKKSLLRHAAGTVSRYKLPALSFERLDPGKESTTLSFGVTKGRKTESRAAGAASSPFEYCCEWCSRPAEQSGNPLSSARPDWCCHP